jgi:tetratricopeptide (TPR) repeat protein
MISKSARSRMLVVVVALSAAACLESPEEARVRHLQRGNDYAADKKLDEAIIEYRNAIQSDPQFGEARYRLGLAYLEAGNLELAYWELVRAADLLPESVDAQMRAGNLLLAGRQFEEARARADRALAVDPKHVEAQILRANAIGGLKDLDTAVREVEEAIRMDPEHANAYTNLGAIQFARGNTAEAEAAFSKALATNPASIAAHLALANFFMAVSRTPDAERTLKAAVALAPADVTANRTLATFYLTTGRPADAEAPLKIVADNSTNPSARIALADYYLASERVDEGLRLLESLEKTPSVASDARLRLAAARYLRGERAAAHEMIDAMLARQKHLAPALVLKARFLLAEERPADALTLAKRAVAADPRSAAANYLAGVAHAALANFDDAVPALNEALRLNPRAQAARLKLAKVELERGATASSVQVARELVTAAPRSVTARMALVRSLMANGEAGAADRELRPLAAQFPADADVQALIGAVSLGRGDRRGARAAFTRALDIDGTSDEARSSLIAIDLADGRLGDAITRADAWVSRSPNHSPALRAAAVAYRAGGDTSKAEHALRTAIAVNPDDFEAYSALGRLLIELDRLEEAGSGFSTLVSRQTKPVGALTMVAMVEEARGRIPEARAAYERALDLDPQAAVAANNLAMLTLRHGGNLDVALSLAQAAKRRLPGSPEVNDTLGQLYIRKDLASLAIEPLRESVAQDPDNHEYLYRLGTAYAKVGDHRKARTNLTRALAVRGDFEGAAEARTLLASLK